MTDPGAPPLNPILQKLEAVLRGIEQNTEHAPDCYWSRKTPTFDDVSRTWVGGVCTCGRVRAEQARTVERMIKAAAVTGIAKAVTIGLKYGEKYGEGNVPHGWDTPILDAAWAAALRAGEGET